MIAFSNLAVPLHAISKAGISMHVNSTIIKKATMKLVNEHIPCLAYAKGTESMNTNGSQTARGYTFTLACIVDVHASLPHSPQD
eukprot:426030-Pleurochrysis_carterae.AAC.1